MWQGVACTVSVSFIQSTVDPGGRNESWSTPYRHKKLRGLSASELYRPGYRFLLAKLVPTFADRGWHVVSVTDPYGRIADF
jgi:hypothetical protein